MTFICKGKKCDWCGKRDATAKTGFVVSNTGKERMGLTCNDCSNAVNATNEEILEIDCDILVPAALENVITMENVNKIKTKLILELANGPVSSNADVVLNKRGIVVIPDVLANAGGVTVSYYEWEQNLKDEHWSKEEVNKKLEKQISKNTILVIETAKKYGVSTRLGAYILSISRIAKKAKEELDINHYTNYL